jgi:hypothetical protein
MKLIIKVIILLIPFALNFYYRTYLPKKEEQKYEEYERMFKDAMDTYRTNRC